jgi:hypothetical protein
VVVVATQFSNGVSAILEILDTAPEAASLGVTPKQDISAQFCPGGGTADLNGLLAGGQQVTLDLVGCAGSALAAAPVSGNVTLTISSVSDPGGTVGPTIDGSASVGLSIESDTSESDTSITGTFDVSARVSLGFLQNGRILLRLGAQGDEDLITVFEAGQELKLACFDIDVGLSNVEPNSVTPLGVADLSGQVFTINDYAAGTTPIIGFDSSGVPNNGEMTLHSGDLSAKMGSDRSSPCPLISGTAGDPSLVTATFSAGGCIDLQGVNKDGTTFQSSTSWDKLLDRDFTSGGGGSCGGGGEPTGATPSPVDCPAGSDIVASADAYIRGGTHAVTSFGTRSNLLVKGVSDVEFARKFYVVFDLSTAPEGFTKASLILTLERHVGRTPVNMYGIVDNDGWDLSTLAEDAINWMNAPRNDRLAGNLFEMSDGVRLLADRYDFDLPDPADDPDPDGTKYSLDVTDYAMWALGNNSGFSSAPPDDKKMISLLFAIPGLEIVDGSAFKSLDIPDEEMCDRPFLHFE